MERLVRFSLFGQEFSFYTDAPEEEVDHIVSFVRKELGADEQAGPSIIPSNKMVVLGCLRIAARYFELEKQFELYRSEQAERVDKLIAKMASGMD